EGRAQAHAARQCGSTVSARDDAAARPARGLSHVLSVLQPVLRCVQPHAVVLLESAGGLRRLLNPGSTSLWICLECGGSTPLWIALVCQVHPKRSKAVSSHRTPNRS